MARTSDFDTAVPLPPGLEVAAIRRAIDYMEKELADLVEIYHEQANVFSAIVGIYGTRALHFRQQLRKTQTYRHRPATLP